MSALTSFAPLPVGVFDVIVCDPPWRYRTWNEKKQTKSASRYYDLMTIQDIAALPVAGLAARDCLLLLWATGAMLDQQIDVARSWGFQFKSEIVWRKTTRTGKVRMGTGYWARSMHEPVIVATRGKPKARGFPSLFDGVAREHSRKPDEFYSMVERRMPETRRADVFSRESRPGWESWGNEAGKFDAP